MRDTKRKNCKNSEKGAWPGLCDLLLMGYVTYFQILGPPNISEMAEGKNLKFCTRIAGLGHTNHKKSKTVKRVRGHGHVTYF